MAGHAGYFYGSLFVANDGNPCHRRLFYSDELRLQFPDKAESVEAIYSNL